MSSSPTKEKSKLPTLSLGQMNLMDFPRQPTDRSPICLQKKFKTSKVERETLDEPTKTANSLLLD